MACRLFRVAFIFSETHSFGIFSVRYVASKDHQTSDLKRVGDAKPECKHFGDSIQISSKVFCRDLNGMSVNCAGLTALFLVAVNGTNTVFWGNDSLSVFSLQMDIHAWRISDVVDS